MSAELHTLTLAQMQSALQAGDVSSRELVDHSLKRIDSLNPDINAILQVDVSGAKAAADAADAKRAAGDAGPLTGIPMAHKDIFCTTRLNTTCGSRMLENFAAPYNATVVDRLNEAGMVMVGKANMDEFAMGSSNENSYFGAVGNPWNKDFVPGGSSGGSAAAVAARMVPAATATDTGGSIRQPAAFCGITGIKPTYGRVSRYGMIAFASSLDQGGVVAATAEDNAMVLQAMCGFDERDSTSADVEVPDFTAGLNESVKGLTIGLPEEYFGEGLDTAVGDAVQAGIKELEALGATVKSISLPNQHLCIPAYYVVAPAEASSNLSRFDGVRFGHRCEDPKDLEDLYKRSRGEGFGAEVIRRIMIGTYTLSAGYYDAYYKKAQQIRRLISDDFDKAFESVDVVLGPTTPTPAFKRGAKTDDPVAMYLNDLYTVSANLSGFPGLSMPCGLVNELPVGMQLIGRAFDESRILSVAHQFQQATDWHQKMPATV